MSDNAITHVSDSTTSEALLALRELQSSPPTRESVLVRRTPTPLPTMDDVLTEVWENRIWLDERLDRMDYRLDEMDRKVDGLIAEVDSMRKDVSKIVGAIDVSCYLLVTESVIGLETEDSVVLYITRGCEVT